MKQSKKASFALSAFVFSIFAFQAFGADVENAAPTPEEKGTADLLAQILSKLGAVRDLRFDINLDTSLPGNHLADSFVSLDLPLKDAIQTHIGVKPTEKPNFFIGNQGLLIGAEADVKRKQETLHVQAKIQFKNQQGSAVTLPLQVEFEKYPHLKVRMHNIVISTVIADEKNAEGKALPLGQVIQGRCVADVRDSFIDDGSGQARESWKAFTACQFTATFNKTKNKYDVSMRLKNN